MANATILLSKDSDEYKQLEVRASSKYGNTVNAIGSREISRYYELLKIGRKTVRKIFTENELQLITDICNGTAFEPIGMILQNNGLLMQFQDSIEYEDYCGKWSVDENQITVKLSDLDYSAQMAIIDAMEIFWSNTEKYSTLLECLKDLK